MSQKFFPFFYGEYTVCLRSGDPFYIVTYYIKWLTTSWTHSAKKKLTSCMTCSLPALFFRFFKYRLQGLNQLWDNSGLIHQLFFLFNPQKVVQVVGRDPDIQRLC